MVLNRMERNTEVHIGTTIDQPPGGSDEQGLVIVRIDSHRVASAELGSVPQVAQTTLRTRTRPTQAEREFPAIHQVLRRYPGEESRGGLCRGVFDVPGSFGLHENQLQRHL